MANIEQYQSGQMVNGSRNSFFKKKEEDSGIDVYQYLAAHLDKLPGGFPATENGVEIRILKHFFSPGEAELAVCLSMIPELPHAIATRTGLNAEALALKLEKMSRKGLIYRIGKGEKKAYSAAMFIMGIWEFHCNDLTEDLVQDFTAYLPQIHLKSWMKSNTRHKRIVPVRAEIVPELNILSYDDAEALIKSQEKVVLGTCICRKEQQLVGKGCAGPLDVCLFFGNVAYYCEENHLGRSIGVQEALEALERGRKAGLVLQPSNAQVPSTLCMCCGCCCLFLKNIKAMDKPGLYVHTNYYAQVDEEKCIACGACADRCHMNAIIVGEIASVNSARCIGCGVCVTDCATGAMLYKQKEKDAQYIPPMNIHETFMNMTLERKKLNP